MRKSIEQKSQRELIKTLDRIFSEYIRLKATNDDGYCQCITCGKWFHWKNIHCGHFISRKEHVTRYDEINCNPQCCQCNTYRQGEWLAYESALIRKYGKDEIKILKQKALIGGKFTKDLLIEMIRKYQEKLKIFKIEKI
jgi:hypothetical protein